MISKKNYYEHGKDQAEKFQLEKVGTISYKRQWGTVREDYSESGSAWDFVTHDMARSKAYRWGEEGIAGISDDQHLLCFALSLGIINDADANHYLLDIEC